MSVDFAELKKTQRGRVLHVLADLDWHPYLDLAAVGGVRYSARILELKRLGYKIETRTVIGGETGFDYRLKSLTPGVAKKKMVKVFLNEDEAGAIVARLRGLHCRGRHHELSALRAMETALSSFRANRHKL